MGYYIRVLVIGEEIPSVDRLRRRLEYAEIPGRIRIETGREESWTDLVLIHADGTEIATLERNAVEPGSLGEEEIAEFAEAVAAYQPASAAGWLKEFFPQVKAIYAFQILNGADKAPGWSMIHEIQGEIWRSLGGILQSDGEGFSNLDGYHILWQFPDDAMGSWKMAVLSPAGKWEAFEMDLGDPEQRAAFLMGQLPDGARLISE